MINYNIEDNLSVEEFKDVLVRSTLGERRPIDDSDRLQQMLEHADLIVTARFNELLVGVSRAITDFAYCTYLSDLAIDAAHQRRGIGKELIRRTKLATPKAKLILLSAPAAIDYYPKIGMNHHKFCYFVDDIDKIED